MEFIGLYRFINKKELALMNHKLGDKITGDSTSYSHSSKYEVDNIPIFFVV